MASASYISAASQVTYGGNGQGVISTRVQNGPAKPGQQSAIVRLSHGIRKHADHVKKLANQEAFWAQNDASDLDIVQKCVLLLYWGSSADVVFPSFAGAPRSLKWGIAGVALSGFRAGDHTQSTAVTVQCEGSVTITNTGNEVIQLGEYVALMAPNPKGAGYQYYSKPGTKQFVPLTVPLRLLAGNGSLDDSMALATSDLETWAATLNTAGAPASADADEDVRRWGKHLLRWSGVEVDDDDDDVEMLSGGKEAKRSGVTTAPNRTKDSLVEAYMRDTEAMFAGAERGDLRNNTSEDENPPRDFFRTLGKLNCFMDDAKLVGKVGAEADDAEAEMRSTKILLAAAQTKLQSRYLCFWKDLLNSRVLGQALAVSLSQGALHINLGRMP